MATGYEQMNSNYMRLMAESLQGVNNELSGLRVTLTEILEQLKIAVVASGFDEPPFVDPDVFPEDDDLPADLKSYARDGVDAEDTEYADRTAVLEAPPPDDEDIVPPYPSDDNHILWRRERDRENRQAIVAEIEAVMMKIPANEAYSDHSVREVLGLAIQIVQGNLPPWAIGEDVQAEPYASEEPDEGGYR